MKIWAHRGCSQMYPENTLLAFEKAAKIKGLTGIELDIQLTRDGEIVVCHDEKVDRTTDGSGYVKDYTLAELKKLAINISGRDKERIPTIEEVFDLLKGRLDEGLKINIELKNSTIPYVGMEGRIVELVHRRGIQENIVYSSFYAKSLQKLRNLDANAELGILDMRASDCLFKLKGGCGANALHPYWKKIDLEMEQISNYTVRAFFSGHLYPEKPTGTRLDLAVLEKKGITDVFLNEPEMYLE
ncbi:MAG: hypothetical protein K2P65_16380 [Lachnospiraceae bacterium]|nr:hypothetical protein [Lachnospiraceae bacterium]